MTLFNKLNNHYSLGVYNTELRNNIHQFYDVCHFVFGVNNLVKTKFLFFYNFVIPFTDIWIIALIDDDTIPFIRCIALFTIIVTLIIGTSLPLFLSSIVTVAHSPYKSLNSLMAKHSS